MKWLALLLILFLAAPALAASVSITIYGTNADNAQTNVTKYGANNTVIVNAWNTSYVKNITVNSTNVSGDTIKFNISNVTANSIFELKVNGTSINGYKAGANGMLNFSYVIPSNLNQTFVIGPARRADGYNQTWAWFKNLIVDDDVGIGTTDPTSGTKLDVVGGDVRAEATSGAIRYRLVAGSNQWNIEIASTLNRFEINDGGQGYQRFSIDNSGSMRGDGSGLWGLNRSNLTTGANAFQNSSDITASGCTQDTVRQNTNTEQQFITISWLGTGVEEAKILSDSNNPPTAVRAISMSNTAAYNAMVVIVQSNNYWKWTGGSAPTIKGCYEWH